MTDPVVSSYPGYARRTVTWKPKDDSLSYAYIRELEQELFGEWFTVDGLPSKADEDRLRPIKLARAFEVCECDAPIFDSQWEIEA